MHIFLRDMILTDKIRNRLSTVIFNIYSIASWSCWLKNWCTTRNNKLRMSMRTYKGTYTCEHENEAKEYQSFNTGRGLHERILEERCAWDQDSRWHLCWHNMVLVSLLPSPRESAWARTVIEALPNIKLMTLLFLSIYMIPNRKSIAITKV